MMLAKISLHFILKGVYFIYTLVADIHNKVSGFRSTYCYSGVVILQIEIQPDFLTCFLQFLTLSLPVTHCASFFFVGYDIDLSSNSNISRTVRVDIGFTRTFSKEYLISFLMISVSLAGDV